MPTFHHTASQVFLSPQLKTDVYSICNNSSRMLWKNLTKLCYVALDLHMKEQHAAFEDMLDLKTCRIWLQARWLQPSKCGTKWLLSRAVMPLS